MITAAKLFNNDDVAFATLVEFKEGSYDDITMPESSTPNILEALQKKFPKQNSDLKKFIDRLKEVKTETKKRKSELPLLNMSQPGTTTTTTTIVRRQVYPQLHQTPLRQIPAPYLSQPITTTNILVSVKFEIDTSIVYAPGEYVIFKCLTGAGVRVHLTNHMLLYLGKETTKPGELAGKGVWSYVEHMFSGLVTKSDEVYGGYILKVSYEILCYMLGSVIKCYNSSKQEIFDKIKAI